MRQCLLLDSGKNSSRAKHHFFPSLNQQVYWDPTMCSQGAGLKHTHTHRHTYTHFLHSWTLQSKRRNGREETTKNKKQNNNKNIIKVPKERFFFFFWARFQTRTRGKEKYLCKRQMRIRGGPCCDSWYYEQRKAT